jgi:hypothetical protein
MHWYLRYVKKTANRKACVLNLCTLLCVAAPLRTLRETVGVKHQISNQKIINHQSIVPSCFRGFVS